MSSQTPTDETEAISKFHSLSKSIFTSLEDLKALASERSKAPSKPVEQQWVVPHGSQYIPHPRTIPDILLRSAVIQLCAALAYALFLRALRQILRRKRRRVTDLPGPQWIWPLLSVLIPELILVQISLWVICGFCPSVAEILGIERPQDSRARASRRISAPSQNGASLTLLQAIALIVPLYYASKAYEQRLLMRYHEASYVANTGLDHRNGWAVVSGLVCCAATILLSLLLRIKGSRKAEEPIASHSGASKHLEAIAEEDEEGIWDGPQSPSHSNHSKRKDSNTGNQGPQAKSSRSRGGSPGSAHKSLSALLSDSEAILTLVLSSVIHQIPLAATNRLPPLTAMFTTRWCLMFVPIVVLSVLTLSHAERLALRRAVFSLSGGDKMIVLFTVLRTMTMVVPWLLVGSTIFLQIWSDSTELRSLKHGLVQPWNYRWRVKDIFSHGDPDRVYMGGW